MEVARVVNMDLELIREIDQFPAMHLVDFKIHFVGTLLRPHAR